jgi:hypothetical protein
MTTRGMQYIIDNAAAIEFGRAKTVGQLVTRSGRMATAERASTVPWQLIVTPPAYSKYEDVRDVIEGITVTDRNTLFYIDFNNSTNLNYITEYQGDMTQTQQDALRVSTSTGFLGQATFDIESIVNYVGTGNTSTFDYMKLTNLPAIGATGANGVITTSSVMFKSGDWIQFNNSASPWGQYTNYVFDRGLPRTVPLDVLRGSGTTVNVPVHRPFVFNGTSTYAINGRAGGDISIGKYVRMGFYLTKMPAWKLLPGKLVQWSGDFEMYERIGD